MAGKRKAEPKEFRLPQSLLGWATLVVVLVSSIALGANRPVSWTLLAMAVFALFALQLLLDIFRGVPKNAARVWLPASFYLVALGWAVVQTLPGLPLAYAHPIWALVPDAPASISADPIAGHQYIARLASYGMIFWLALRSTQNVDRAMMFLKAIAIFSTALAVFGLAALLSGANPILGDSASDVLSATFINRNSYATYAVIGLLTNLALYLRLTKSDGLRTRSLGHSVRDFLELFFGGAWIFAFGFLICLSALVLTQSRAGTVAGLLGLAAYAATYRRQNSGSNPIVLAILIAIVSFVVVILTAGVFSRLITTTEEENRFQIYSLVVDGIMARPFLGHGLGAFYDTFRAYVPVQLANVEWNLAHNSYLENIYELGVPAAVSFYAALAFIAFVLVRGAFTRRSNRIYSCLAISTMLAAGFHAAFDFSLQIPAIASLFALILGIGWAQSFRRDTQ